MAPAQAGHEGLGAPAPGGGAGLLQLSPDRQQMIGLKLGTVERRRLGKTIRAVGRVDYDEKRLVTVSPKIGGWIEELYVDFTGRQVKKGEPLLTIFSQELLATQEEYLVALKAKQELSKSHFPEVAASGNTLAEAARRRLKLLDISEEQIKGLEKSGQSRRTLTLFAPYNGVVVERLAYKGMNVMPGQALFKLADLSVVWLNAEIYEADVPFIRQGQQASVSLSYLPGESLMGRVIYVYPFLDPKTRTVRVRLELPNPEGRLKPEMYAQVQIESDQGERLVVPEGAVIDTGTRQVVFVARQPGAFERREIKAGIRAEDYVEVLSGLMAGDRVVTSANFLVDSESRFKEAVGGGGAHAGHGK
jgi:Cu(I)/Ag(I) efflux system membrane fusion protein